MDISHIQLSEEQRIIVELTEGQHLVLAPPGTGKTELLAHRVLYALKNGIEPDQIVCLTFTNRAARSMKERIESIIPNCDVFIGNIHSFCWNFLNKYRLISKAYVLIDEQDSNELFEEVLQSKNLTLKTLSDRYRTYLTNDDLRKINAAEKQRKLNFPSNLILEISGLSRDLRSTLLEVCNDYENIKRESLYLDFDDLLIYVYDYLRKNHLNDNFKFSWIQVDEIQDLNSLQYEIIELISSVNAHRVYFGDYEQSIFSFMGAKLENLHRLEKKCKVHNLQKNFRSPSYLLNVYVDYAKANLDPKWKRDPYSAIDQKTPKGHLLLVKSLKSKNEELNMIIENFINNFTDDENSQTAVLFRKNDDVDDMSFLLNRYHIPHFKISKNDLFRSKVVKDIMAFLNCIIDENSRMNWARLFVLFSNLKTLKEARYLVNKMFLIGLLPTNFLSEKEITIELKEFQKIFEKGRLIIFDTETTGTNVLLDDIVQIAAIEIINGKINKTFNIYLKTEKDLSRTEKIHKISRAFLDAHGVNPKVGLEKFLNFIEDAPVVAHNLDFDYQMLVNNCKRNQIRIYENQLRICFDTIKLTQTIYQKLYSYSLENLINMFKLNSVNTHNAMDDVKATFELINFLSKDFDKHIQKQIEFIIENEKVFKSFRVKLLPLWLETQKKLNSDMKVTDLIQLFIEYSRYKLTQDEKTNLDKLFRHMNETCKEARLIENLRKYVPQYELFREADLILGDEKVIVSTIHKAKGLEFTNVIIPSCNNGNYPFFGSDNEKEDARLLYVAMTRAKKRLIISANKFGASKFLQKIEKRFEVIEIQ